MREIERRGVLVFLAAAWGATGVVPAFAEPAVTLGQLAPPFAVTTFSGGDVTLPHLHDRVVLLNFAANWNAGELATLAAFARAHDHAPLSIFVTAPGETAPPSKVPPVTLARTIAGAGYRQIGGASSSTYVIDKFGLLRYAGSAPLTGDLLERVVAPLLAVVDPPTARASERTERSPPDYLPDVGHVADEPNEGTPSITSPS
jgi:hypothetical protein